MALTQFLDDLKIIQRLGDQPNRIDGLSADEMKEKFDAGSIIIQEYINKTLLPELTAEFKTKSPAGYGYGGVVESLGTAADESDLEFKLTSAMATLSAGEAKQVAFIVSSLSNMTFLGTMFKSSAGYGFVSATSGLYGHTTSITKYLLENTWQPLEWINPPMELGVEYRTTERWLGKPVYTKAVDFGALPNAISKNVLYTSSAAASVISLHGVLSDGCCVNSGTNVDRSDFSDYTIIVDNTHWNVRVLTNGDLSALTAVFQVKYVYDES